MKSNVMMKKELIFIERILKDISEHPKKYSKNAVKPEHLEYLLNDLKHYLLNDIQNSTSNVSVESKNPKELQDTIKELADEGNPCALFLLRGFWDVPC